MKKIFDGSYLTGSILVFTSAICFSAKAVVIKLAYRLEADAVTLLALRMLCALPFFLLLMLRSVRKTTVPLTRKQWFLIFFCGIVGYYLASLFDFLGLQYISAGLERLILFVYPTLVVLISSIFLKTRFNAKVLIALVLSYGGIALVFFSDKENHSSNALIGGGLILLSALTYALYLVVGGEMIQAIGSSRFTALAMTISCLAILVHFAITRNISSLFNQEPRVFGYAILMGIVSTVLPSLLLAAGIKRVGSGPASIIGSIGPVSTISLAAIFLDERVELIQILGTALVLAGVLIVSLQKRVPVTSE